MHFLASTTAVFQVPTPVLESLQDGPHSGWGNTHGVGNVGIAWARSLAIQSQNHCTVLLLLSAGEPFHV